MVRELSAAGHQVLGLTRSQQGADSLAAAGVEAHLGDIEDFNSLQRGADLADAVIHTAFNHDFFTFVANCARDRQAIEAMGAALKGSQRPLIITSGVGMGAIGANTLAVEDYFNSAHSNPRKASELAGIAVTQHPGWHFTGVDPSPDMLAICAEKLQREGLSNRCTLIEGYLDDVPVSGDYDVALCLLVIHFIQDAQRLGIYSQMNAQLAPGGRMIAAEIAGDMQADDFDEKMAMWAAMHSVASNTERDAQEIKAQLRERLLLLAPEQTEQLIAASGFNPPQRFFQSLLIHGWTAKKQKTSR